MKAVNSSASCWRKALGNFWRDFEWPVVGGLAVVALALGGFGYHAQFRADGGTRALWDILYFDIQLFLIQMPEMKGALHPALNVARFLAPAVAGYTAWQALASLFADQLQSFKLRVLRDHVVVSHARRIAEVLRARYPGLDKACDLTVCEMDVRAADFASASFLAETRHGGRRASVFVCLDDDSLSLSTALAIAPMVDGAQSTIIVRMAQDAGLATLLQGVPDDRGRFQHLRVFALLDRACQPEQVLRGMREILARAIHAEYIRHQRATGDTPEKNSSMRPWDELTDDLRKANHDQAEDLDAKLAAVRCQIEPMPDWTEPFFEFTPGETESLSEREHIRWMDAKLRDGWRHGATKDSKARTHPCLVAYAELPEREKEKDRETVRAIPKFLATVGFRVYRMANKPPVQADDTP